MNEFFYNEQFPLAFTGISSIVYACYWIRKILKSPKPYHKQQVFFVVLALLAIILGISTAFTKFTLNCLCGVYGGASEFIILYKKYLEDMRTNTPWHDGIIYYANGIGIGLTLILLSLNFIMNLFFE